jgi:putative secretion ATPase (PEP-CTERM system associated)
MYQNFYSFTAMPFQLTPDSRFYFDSQEHRRAMAFLQYGLSQQEGFVVVTGEIGAGKTMLVEHLLSQLDRNEYVVARVVTTQLGGYDTLCVIANAFGIDNEGLDKGPLISRVREFFTTTQGRGRHVLVIVDEAQSLTMEAVEELRMLSNLTAGPRAPFQGIFLGQPEFRIALSSPELQQLRQRVIASCHLGALNADDTRRYIEHRLLRVGWNNDPVFSDGAFEEIHQHSGGIPRRINSLCSRLLLLGYLEERHVIEASAVADVAREMVTELGLLDTPTPAAEFHVHAQPASVAVVGELQSRLTQVERTTDRQGKAIARVLDLALKYLPAEAVRR